MLPLLEEKLVVIIPFPKDRGIMEGHKALGPVHCAIFLGLD